MSETREYDQGEAVFHKMEPDLRPSQESEGSFLAESLRKKLDSAFAAIPEPLRDFLEALTDAYELDDFDAVLEYVEDELCGEGCSEDEDEDADEEDRVQFSEEEVERAWEFIKNYMDSVHLLDAANDAADELLNPAIDEVQKCN